MIVAEAEQQRIETLAALDTIAVRQAERFAVGRVAELISTMQCHVTATYDKVQALTRRGLCVSC